MKNTRILAIAAIVLAVGALVPIRSYVVESAASISGAAIGLPESAEGAMATTGSGIAVTSEADTAAPQEAEEKAVSSALACSVIMYKGDTGSLDLSLKKGSKVTMKSTDKSIVRVNRKTGKIKAKAPGKAAIKIQITKKDKSVQKLNVYVTVRYSSYLTKTVKGSGISKNAAADRVLVHNVLYAGTDTSLRLKGEEGMESTFTSSNPSVAAVDAQGKVTAKTKGTATITIKATTRGVAQTYKVRLHVRNRPELNISDSQVEKYFSGQAFAGNSVGLGFSYFCERWKSEGHIDGLVHLTAVSYSFANDRAAISAKSLHPTYQGKKYRVKDAVKAAGCKHIYMVFGMNDINLYGVYGTADNYKEFVQEMRKTNPDLKVTILSMTPVRQDKGRINNADIDKLNKLLKSYASDTDYVDYIDVNTQLKDGSGLLASGYCSDGFCHLTVAAYQKWAEALRAYARQQLQEEVKEKDAQINHAAGLK